MTQIHAMALVTACAILVSTACGKKVLPTASTTPPPTVAEAPPAPPAPEPASEAAASPLSAEEIFARKTLEELNAERPLGDAFFDFDQATLRDDARATAQVNAEWLLRWTSTRIAIEGHGDARGTSEYNLALGERRGTVTKNYLVSLGVEPGRLVVVSKGEESPVCVEENESCWQQNRRAHHVVTAK